MAELKNTFSWSFSAMTDFEDCRRRRYWAKYGMWGGWDRRAPEDSKKAYLLNKMNNRWSIQGQAVEKAVMWVLEEAQAGRNPTTEEAYEQIAKPYLNRLWKESKSKAWLQSPKKFCNLREHYYESAGTDAEWISGVTDTTKRCIENFTSLVLDRLRNVTKNQEIEIATVTKGGDPEHFIYEGIKIYAIPDYVYTEDNIWHIIDWKSGRRKPEHDYQIAVYGLWAHIKYGIAPENIVVSLEYLSEGKTLIDQFSEERMSLIRERMSDSVGEMREYLIDNSLERNEPLPKSEWDLAPDRSICRMCNFIELCDAELTELGI